MENKWHTIAPLSVRVASKGQKAKVNADWWVNGGKEQKVEKCIFDDRFLINFLIGTSRSDASDAAEAPCYIAFALQHCTGVS